MKTVSLFAAIMFSIFSINSSTAQTTKTETIKVWGNCGMCKTKIEKAAKAAGAKTANWNEDSKELKISYAANKTTSVKIQQAIAKSGYDTQDFTAVNTAYNNLPGCCKYDRKEGNTAVAVVNPMGDIKTETIAIAEVKEQLPALLSLYLDIKNALVSSNATIAAAKAAELVKTIDAINMQQLSATDHNAFMAVQDKLKTSAQAISESNKIDDQRTAFSTLSNTFYTLAKSAKLSDATVYQQYCPMKKMYWLSSEAAVKNPYYGKAMLTCGKVTDTVK